jgi:hypothetical protein
MLSTRPRPTARPASFEDFGNLPTTPDNDRFIHPHGMPAHFAA